MNDSAKKIIAGAAGAAVIAGAVILGNPAPSPLTADEFNNLVAVYDYEIDQSGGDVDLKNIRNNAIDLFDQKIVARTETKSVVINGKIYTADQYTALRADLIKKASKNMINKQ